MFKADDSPSAFASRGTETFPPTYYDNKSVGEFSDELRWPTGRLLDKLGLYLGFVKQEQTMPRARQIGRRIIDHVIFELSAREGAFVIDDTPTEEIPVQKKSSRILPILWKRQGE